MCGLSQKQIWRRQSSKGKVRLSEASLVAVDDNKDKEMDADEAQYLPPTTTPEPYECTESAETDAETESLTSASDSEESLGCAVKKSCASAKEVTFSGFVKVMLIPCIVEYKDAGLCDIIWWTPADMHRFKVETIMSVQKYMLHTKVRDIKQALRMLLDDEAVHDTHCV